MPFWEVIKSVIFSLTATAATMEFKAIETVLLNQDDANQVLAVQYELLVIAITAVISAHAAAHPNDKDVFWEPLFTVRIIAFIVFILMASATLTGLQRDSLSYSLVTVLIPDILGFVAIGRAVFATRELNLG